MHSWAERQKREIRIRDSSVTVYVFAHKESAVVKMVKKDQKPPEFTHPTLLNLKTRIFKVMIFHLHKLHKRWQLFVAGALIESCCLWHVRVH